MNKLCTFLSGSFFGVGMILQAIYGKDAPYFLLIVPAIMLLAISELND